MAFYNESNDQDEDVLQEGQAPVSGQQSSTIGTSGGPSASKDQQSAAATPISPSTFAGIQDYVNANKSQTAKLAGDVGGLVTGYGNEARSQINQGQERFNQAVDQNTVKGNDPIYNQISGDPAQLTSDNAKFDEVVRMRNAQYGGPTSLETTDFYQPIHQAFNKAQEASDSTQSDAGQRTLLSQLQNSQKGKVNQGSLQLNSALLQGDINARSILDQARDSNSDLATLFNSAKEDSVTKANLGKSTTDQTRQNTNTALNNSWQALKDLVAGKVTQAQGNYTPASAFSSTGTPITDAQLSNVGLTRAQYESMKSDPYVGTNLAQYVSAPANIYDINANTVASQEDYAREAALMALAGYDSSQDFIKTPELAGTGVISNTPFAKGTIAQKGIDAAKARYDAAMVIANRKNRELLAANALDPWRGTGRDEAVAALAAAMAKYNSWKL